MKRFHATQVDHIIAGIQSRSVSRRNMIAENERTYTMLRRLAQTNPETEDSKNYGKTSKALRKALNEIARDQKLDKDTMKLLRACQSIAFQQAKAPDNIAGFANNIHIAAQNAFLTLAE